MRTLTRALRTRTILPLLLSSFSLIISVDASGSTRGKWYPIPNGSAGSSFGWDSLRNDTLVMGGATHMALMRGGAGDTAWVLHWHLGHQARLWLAVPNDTSFAGKRARNVPLPRDVSAPWDSTELFCAGHSHLHDGKLLVVGGTASAEGRPIGSVGSKYTATYDPSTYAWSFRDEMEFGRWYPTSTTLGDGRVLATGGKLSRPITIFGGRQDGGLSQDLRSGAAISPGGTGNTTGSNVVWADDESIIVPNPRAMAREGHTLVHYAGHDRYFIWGGVGQGSTESPVWVSPDTIRVAFGKTLDGGKKWEWTWRYPSRTQHATASRRPAHGTARP